MFLEKFLLDLVKAIEKEIFINRLFSFVNFIWLIWVTFKIVEITHNIGGYIRW